MKSIGFIGQGSREKSFLMMYLGKLLSGNGKVTIITEDQWFIPALGIFEYSPRLSIEKKEPDDLDMEYLLLDITELYEGMIDIAFYLTGIQKETVDFNTHMFNLCEAAGEKAFIFQNMLMDGKINDRYLCRRMGIDPRHQKVWCQYLNDNDLAVNVENVYDERLDMKPLSKSYKRLLMDMTGLCDDSGKRVHKRWLSEAERSQ